jgi:putative transposase
MDRLVLSDGAWERMAPLVIGRPDQKGSTGRDNRMFVEAVLWIVRTGSPWRDLPEVFGNWNNTFRRFSRWSATGGAPKGCGGGYSRRCRTIPTSNTSSSTPRLFAPTSMPPGRKRGV